MEYLRLFLKKLKVMRFQVWNLAKFQTWNRNFFWFCKKSCECSKINEIYLLWILSELIFSKIKEPFSGGQEGGRSGGREVIIRGTARARLALSFFPSSSLSFLSFPSFLSFRFLSFPRKYRTCKNSWGGFLFSFPFLVFFSFLSFLFFS